MQNQPASPKNQRILTTLAVLIVITILAVGVKAFSHQSGSQMTLTPGSSGATSSHSASASANDSATYKDGTYVVTATYGSPGGTQSVVVSLTLAGNKVSDSTVQGQAKSGVAQIYQSYFVDGYKQYVVGKKLNDIHLSRVSSSSLTSIGFNEAVRQIKNQAKG